MSLIDRLKRNEPTLTELAGFGRHTVAEISDALVKNTTVNSFKFTSCELDNKDCATIMNALTKRYTYQANNLCVTCRPRTKRISLARNNIGAAGAVQIAQFLSYPSLECKEDPDATVHCKCTSICYNCGNDRFTAPRFFEDFVRLELLANAIGDIGAAEICLAMTSFDANINDRSHCVVELGFERNGISDACMLPICQMLKINNTLRSLHLGRNDITHIGMINLADALQHNKTLEVLNLSGNSYIGDDGARILAESLKNNTTLKTLLLKKCGVSDHGCYQLIKALCNEQSPFDVTNDSNHTLTEISLCSKYVCSYVAMNTLTLRTLLTWNAMGSVTAQRLKMGFYLCSYNGIKHVHSLGLDRKLFPILLRRLWRVFRVDFNKQQVNKLEVLWNYLRGMPGVVES